MTLSASNPGTSNNLSPRRLKLRLRRLTPLLVWVGVLMLAAPLYFRQVGGGTVTGFAREVRYSVAPEAAGRLNRIEAKLIEENRTIRDELKKVILLQQETSRTHLEEVSEDLQFQVGKMLQRIGRLETRVLELMHMVEKGGVVPTAAEVPAAKASKSFSKKAPSWNRHRRYSPRFVKWLRNWSKISDRAILRSCSLSARWSLYRNLLRSI